MKQDIQYYDLENILLSACKEGKLAVVEFCLKHGVNSNCIQGETLDSPLLIAASNGHLHVIDLLLSNGVDLFSLHNKKAESRLKRVMRLIELNAPPMIISNETRMLMEIIKPSQYKLQNDLQELLNSQYTHGIDFEEDEDEFIDDDDLLLDDEEEDEDEDVPPTDHFINERPFLSLRENPLVINRVIDNRDIPTLLYLCEKLITEYLPYYYNDSTKATESSLELRVFNHAIRYAMNIHAYELALEIVKFHHPTQNRYMPGLPLWVVKSLLNSENLSKDHFKAIEILEALKDKGHSMNYKGPNGKTALHLASTFEKQEYVEVCKALIRFGADWKIRDDHGSTPLKQLVKTGVVDPKVELFMMALEDNQD